MSLGRSVFAVIPVKNPAFGKTRLAPLLSARQRRALCQFLARRTIEACATAFGPQRTIVVTPALDIARYAAQAGVWLVAESARDDGLNAAIGLGVERARLEGAEAVLVVPADLAFVSSSDLRAAAGSIPRSPGCLIVPDRRTSGTNLLGLAPLRPDLIAFGESSLRRHADLATRAGYDVLIQHNEALSLDLDLPEDYLAWRSMPRTQAASAPGVLPR